LSCQQPGGSEGALNSRLHSRMQLHDFRHLESSHGEALGVYYERGTPRTVPKYRLSNPRMLLPLTHAAIALALLSYLYLPGWPEWRRRDVAEQQYIGAAARAGQWFQSDGLAWEACYFGAPRQISVLFPANLPTFLAAGVLVVPCNARDRLLERAPGRMLPSTRILIFIAFFVAVVALQWYLIARLTITPRTSRLWRGIVCIAPVACIPIGLALPEKWADLLRLASLPFWIFMLAGIALQYSRKALPKGQEPLADRSH